MTHFQGENYDKPHVKIENVFPVSTLNLQKEDDKKTEPKQQEETHE